MDLSRRLTLALRIASRVISPTLSRVRLAIAAWEQQKSYHGAGWDGVEQLLFELAPVANEIDIQADQSAWKLLIPDGSSGVVVVHVQRHSHDGLTTFGTTTFLTQDIDSRDLHLIGHPDHCVRTLLWTRRIAQIWGDEAVVSDVQRRLALTAQAKRLVDQLLPKTLDTFHQISGSLPEIPQLHLGVSPVGLENKGKIGVHRPPDLAKPYSTIVIHPKAFKKPSYLRAVVQHELIHYVSNGLGKGVKHGDLFNQMGERLGLPQELRD